MAAPEGGVSLLQAATGQADGVRIHPVLPTKDGGGRQVYSGLALRGQLLRLCAAGVRACDAAKQLGMQPTKLRQIISRPEFKEDLRKINEDAFLELDAELKFRAQATHEKLFGAAEEALDTAIDLMRGADSEVVRMRCAHDLMDRRPDMSKVHRIDKREMRVNIDAKWLEEAAKVAEEEHVQLDSVGQLGDPADGTVG